MKTHFIAGVFDALHPGHEFILREAKYYDMQEPYRLIVAINSDDYIRRKKGREPIDPLETRMRKLGYFADQVIVFDEDSPIKLIEQIKPDVVFCGSDYHEEDVAGFGLTKVVIVPRYKNFATSKLPKSINRSNVKANFQECINESNQIQHVYSQDNS